MSMTLGEFEHRVCGIPCIVAVTSWEAYVPAKTCYPEGGSWGEWGPPEDCYPEEGGCGEWELRDRRGRPAPWLERKLDDKERQRIDQLVFDYMERPPRDEFY